MAYRISMVSQKGGVGKTTLSLNLGLALAEKGLPTLVVDVDPQGGIGHSLAKGETSLPGLADLLMGRCAPGEAVLRTKLPTLALLPRGRLEALDVPEFEAAAYAPGVLDEVLRAVDGEFRRVILDTPAGVGMITRGALAASDFALIPVQAEALALRSIGQILQVIDHVRSAANPRLRLLGVVATMFDKTNHDSYQVLQNVWGHLEGVLETIIPRADVFAHASLEGLPISYLGGPVSPEARRFGMLADEIETLLETFTAGAGHAERQERRELL